MFGAYTIIIPSILSSDASALFGTYNQYGLWFIQCAKRVERKWKCIAVELKGRSSPATLFATLVLEPQITNFSSRSVYGNDYYVHLSLPLKEEEDKVYTPHILYVL